MPSNRTTEKIIGSLVNVSGHTFDMRYDLFFTTERLIVVTIQHPADAPQPSFWKTILLGDMLSGKWGKHEQRRASQRKRRSLQSMNPDELVNANRRNLVIAYSEIASVELKRRFFQWQLRFRVSSPTNKERVVSFNLYKKQVPEAERLLKKASLSKES